MNRRQALSLLATIPYALRLGAQTRAATTLRVIVGPSHGLLFEPGGMLASWRLIEDQDEAALDAQGLGHNRPFPKYALGTVQGLSKVVAAAAGYYCSFAVLSDGRLMAWGINAGDGRLGITSRAEFEATASWAPNSNTPVPVVTKFAAVDVSCQHEHVVALARDGSVYTWGKAGNGRLGIGPLPALDFKRHESAATSYLPFPMRVPDLVDVTAISAGGFHSLALVKDGTVRAWGQNDSGQLGDGTTTDRANPVAVRGVRNAIAVAAGTRGSVAVLADGTVMTWGAVTRADVVRPTPALVPGVRGIRAIAVGAGHAVALTNAGTVMTWGDNTYYELGRGRGASPEPGLVPGLTGVQSIAAGTASGTAVLASGRIMTWGIVRPWTRPDGAADRAPTPILLWLDGLEQP